MSSGAESGHEVNVFTEKPPRSKLLRFPYGLCAPYQRYGQSRKFAEGTAVTAVSLVSFNPSVPY